MNEINRIAELEQENAELKAENERLKELKCKFKEYCTCNTEKYVQCLQEIKEIAECVIDNDNSLKTDHCFGHCGECKSFKHCKLYPYWQITHLITKAEVGE